MNRPRSDKRVVLLHAGDTVAVALTPLEAGSTVSVAGQTTKLVNDIPAGHKFAVHPVATGDVVTKYGQGIGVASQPIEVGEHVHSHNLELHGLARAHSLADKVTDVDFLPEDQVPNFMGYLREDGKVGTRNDVVVVSTVNCSASACRAIATTFARERLRAYPNVDGVVALTHKGGCAMQLGGEDYQQLQRTLAGTMRNPNVGGALLVGLGCEVNQPGDLIENEGLGKGPGPHRPTPEVLVIQDVGGFQETVDAGVRVVEQLLKKANRVRRTPQPVSKLIVGLECGGSDAHSGITANPAVGAAVDYLVRCGGTGILGETPEIYGAEYLLTGRARSVEVGQAVLDRIQWWEDYTSKLGAELDNNPSPGNKEGGLTTIYEKSLGAVAKGGSTPLNAVYRFAEPVTEKGLVFMDTPGYDSASITGFVAGGANLVVFTTGRGSVYGCKPTPSLKVATNSRLAHWLANDIDLDAGVILGGVPVEEVGMRLFEQLVAVASGEPTKSELHDVGEEEFTPWVLGPVL